ncbi:MAG: Dihydrolipoyllysine-residue acetyltransferase component of pyruvate dehydrogenase complex [Chloroflexi bacterium ADurb.Bin325]|nr:MAG: Dihydrolipoyllysine-residue acetyltransferase component of pyruvate dehydrogenase complex [Chloroflexi bacterium ADurb.Bin325]
MAELITMPKLGFDMAEGKLSEWLKQPGEAIKQGETIVLVETDKATVEVPAFRSGTLLEILVEANESVPIGTPIGVIGEAGEKVDRAALGLDRAPEAAPTPAPAAPAPAPVSSAAPVAPIAAPAAEPAAEEGGRLVASPVALRMAAELGINLRDVQGSGPGGRIIKRDIEAFVEAHAAAPTAPVVPAAAPAQPAVAPAPAAAEAEYTVEPLTGLRQTIGKRMTESKQAAPHFYVTMEIDMAAAMALRAQLNTYVSEADKISVNDLVQKAAAIALREFPHINAAWSAEGIRLFNQVNIGHAVARENGLVTAVVRDVDRKTLGQIARETRDLVTRARDGRMKPEEMLGATFTISNLGMFDVTEFIAIINPPQAAILAVGAVQKTPVVNAEGEIVVGLRMRATISADHRATDGAEAARFMQAFKKALEEPMRLLL